jgi:hypothetical protein|tara:strand:+ start:88 stop:507 length:420 start_codon:yes stop_codon:yes gene_type:complete
VRLLADTTSLKKLRESQKRAQSLPKKGTKLSWFALVIQKCLSKKTSPLDVLVLEPDTNAIRPKTNLAPDTGPVKHGDEEMKILELLAKLEKHEAECDLRYQRIEEKLSDQKSSLKAFDLKLWGLAVLILIAPFVGKLLG